MTKLFLSLLLSACAASAAQFSFTGKANKDSFYQTGEPMVFEIQLLEDSKPVEGKPIEWRRTGDDGKEESGKAVSSATPLSISTTMDKPGFVRIEAWIVDENGKPLLDDKKQPTRFDGGSGVEPEKLEQGVPEPADFDSFWAAQKARLAETPMKIAIVESPSKFTLVEVPSDKPDFVAYDIKADCPGGKPVSGYLTMPKDAAPKSLKARVTYRGYGITPADKAYAPGTLMLNINAHGIENGKDAAYYKSLKLEKYAFNNEENAKPETSYFNGMILRVMRSLEFIKSRPEWNGKDLVVSGGSQGGFQALAAAALDKDVTKCETYVPWCCDLGGIKASRLRGWRPDWAEGLGYYDGVNMAKRITCPTTIVAGLGDYVCPPSGVAVLYNNLGGQKSLEFVQGMTHGFTPKEAQKVTLKADAPKGASAP